MNSNQWIAVQVRTNREFAVSSALQVKGYETFVPAYRSVKKWSDRQKACELPLISGYVFVRTMLERAQSPIVSTPGVMAIVGFGGKVSPIDDHEMDVVRTVASSAYRVEPWAYLKQHSLVRISHGPLSGIQGTVIQVRDNSMFIVSIEMLQRSVAVHIDRSWLEPAKT